MPGSPGLLRLARLVRIHRPDVLSAPCPPCSVSSGASLPVTGTRADVANVGQRKPGGVNDKALPLQGTARLACFVTSKSETPPLPLPYPALLLYRGGTLKEVTEMKWYDGRRLQNRIALSFGEALILDGRSIPI